MKPLAVTNALLAALPVGSQVSHQSGTSRDDADIELFIVRVPDRESKIALLLAHELLCDDAACKSFLEHKVKEWLSESLPLP